MELKAAWKFNNYIYQETLQYLLELSGLGHAGKLTVTCGEGLVFLGH